MAVTEPLAETLQRPATGVTAPLGFVAGAAAAGIKQGMPAASGGKLDVGVIYSERPATAAAVFTTNKVKAAPVVISQLNLAGGSARAVVVNSGNANACTGSQGFKDALLMGKLAADELDLDPSQVLVASTGVIGRFLPMDRIREGVVSASRAVTPLGGDALAQAIMTTDTRPKQAAVSFEHVGRRYTVGGTAKGSGMIHVNMATLLAFLTTDAGIAAPDLAATLRRCADRTFNMISIDGDTSTNDMLTLLANGAAGGPSLVAGDGLEEFEVALMSVCEDLSRQVARDGEGASRMFTVEVRGAAAETDARTLARTVVSSMLVKAAIHGADPNWGRIVAALGRAGCEMVLDRLRVDIGGTTVFSNGSGMPEADLAKVAEAFARDEVAVLCDMGIGDGTAVAYGCDLTPEYVHINADYTT
jgi:glutamate N-acetyltransferase/amino-acid N-acetyltransferase